MYQTGPFPALPSFSDEFSSFEQTSLWLITKWTDPPVLIGVFVLVWCFLLLIGLGGTGQKGAGMPGTATNPPAWKILLLGCLTPELQVPLCFKQRFPWGWGKMACPDPQPPHGRKEEEEGCWGKQSRDFQGC